MKFYKLLISKTLFLFGFQYILLLHQLINQLMICCAYSAGVGRTGSYIAIDVELERAKTEGSIDVHNTVQLMRTQRINMVQTLVS